MKKHNGNIFREIRKSKNLTLKDIAQDTMSISFLSKFERAETDISLTNFINLTDHLMITLDEFSFIKNDNQPSPIEKLMYDIKVAYQNNNVIKLEQLKANLEKKEKNVNDRSAKYLVIMIEALICEIKKEKVSYEKQKYLTDYLFSVEYWSMFECILNGNALSIFSIETVILLSKEILPRTQIYLANRKNYEITIHILLNTIIYCLEKDFLNEAYYFIISVKNIRLAENYFYEKTILLFLEGIYEIKTEQSESGNRKTKDALSVMNILGESTLVANHEKFLEDIRKELI